MTVTVNARGGRGGGDKRSRAGPPPDLPSLLFDNRIVYLGMPLVPAVTELMVAELLYLEKQGRGVPIEMLINSSGTTRQDGEILSFDSEGIAVTSVMGFVKNPISTVNMGLAVGWACVILSFGKKGLRKSLPHALAMMQQPRIPPTGQRQAVEVHIKWREVLDYKRDLLRTLSVGTGWPVEKLDADMQRPLYMRPQDALDYGIIDEIIKPNAAKQRKAVEYWVKSGRAESEGRLEEWQEYLSLQEQYALKESSKRVIALDVRNAYRETKMQLNRTKFGQADKERNLERVDKRLRVVGRDGKPAVLLPFSRKGLKMAILNSERYVDKVVERRVKAGIVELPESWIKEIDEYGALHADSTNEGIDFDALVAKVDSMSAEEFSSSDMDQLIQDHIRR